MIGQTISHYRIISQLGEGGMGLVYVAEDTLLGRRVAIKMPMHGAGTHNYHARFLREARSVSALSHPYIAPVFDYGETPDGRPFIVMELIHGQDLGALMRAGALTLARALEIIEHIAAALGEAHSHGIIHRDVKPSNILITDRGEVKVLDFGLAKLIEDRPELAVDSDAQTLMSIKTRSDVIVGTPLYLSPEQATGMPVDARSDLFALGALLYEAVARPAFSGANLIEIAAQVLHVEPPPPSVYNTRVPPELDRITMKALAKRPEARYQKADDLIRDLRACRTAYTLSDSTSVARISRHTTTHNRSALMTLSEGLRRPRLSIAAVLAGVFALTVVIAGLVMLLRPRPHVPAPDAQTSYDKGTDLLRDYAYYQASKWLKDAADKDSQYALTFARLADVLTELDATDEAKDAMLHASTLVRDQGVLTEPDTFYFEGIQATVVRDFPRAVVAYQQLTQLQPKLPQVWVDLGRAYENAGNIDKAIDSYIIATRLNSRYATAYLRVGILYGRKNEAASAYNCFKSAEAIYNDFTNAEGRTEVLYQRAFFQRKLGKLQEARAGFEEALKLVELTKNQFQRVNALLQLSAVAAEENNSTQAEEYARRAVETAQANSMENMTALGLVDLGNIFLHKSDYAHAERYFTQGLELASRQKARRTEAKARINLGSSKLQQWHADEALPYINLALDFYRQGGYRTEMLQGSVMLGRAQRMRGDYEGALHTFGEQLRVIGEGSDQGQLPLVHEGIGSVLALQERYSEALDHFNKRYALSKERGSKIGMSYGQAERASVLWPIGRLDEMRAALAEAREIAEAPDGGIKEVASLVHVTGAELALAQRQFGEARAEAARALQIANEETTQYAESIIRAKRVHGLALARTARPPKGGAYVKRRLIWPRASTIPRSWPAPASPCRSATGRGRCGGGARDGPQRRRKVYPRRQPRIRLAGMARGSAGGCAHEPDRRGAHLSGPRPRRPR